MKFLKYELSSLTVSRLTIFIVGCLLILKLIAYGLSASTAVLSSLMDSITDIGLSSFTYLALTWSSKPKDDDHRHGHGKIEGVSALLQAAFMMGAASFLVLESSSRFLHPQIIEGHFITAIMMVIAIVASYIISTLQRLNAEQTGSVAIKADGAHYSTDVILNAAVLLVVLLDWAGMAPRWLDPLSGVVVAGLFARTAYGMAHDAIDHLMDREVGGDVRDNIIRIIEQTNGIICYHDLRVTGMVSNLFISLDIEVDEHLSLKAAHDIGRDLELKLFDSYPNAEIFIHIDPEGDTHDTRH